MHCMQSVINLPKIAVAKKHSVLLLMLSFPEGILSFKNIFKPQHNGARTVFFINKQAQNFYLPFHDKLEGIV
jgi:hypothetical protein